MKILSKLKHQVNPDNICIAPLILAPDQQSLWTDIPEARKKPPHIPH